MQDSEAVSEKLTRIDNAMTRIRIKTETTGEVIEDVATAVENMVTDTGAFKVSSVEEMNALEDMKVGDYCVIEGVPTYVIPETATFTRFHGTPEEILNDDYKNYLFVLITDVYGANSTFALTTGNSNKRTYWRGADFGALTVSTDSVNNWTVANKKDRIFRFVKENDKLYLKDLNNKYICQGSPQTYGAFWVTTTSTYITNTCFYISKLTGNAQAGNYNFWFTGHGFGVVNGENGWSVITNTSTAPNNLRLYACRMQTTTVDHLVYQYKQDSGWVDVTDEILVPTTNVTPTTSLQTLSIPAGYRGFKNITINATPLESITVTATTEQQTITPTQNKVGISQVIVNPVASSVDPNIIAENIKKGVTILGITGTYEGVVPEEEYEYQLETAKDIAGIQEQGGDN